MEASQKEMFMQFLVVYNDLGMRLKVIRNLIPTDEDLAERDRLRYVPTMTGRTKVSRNLIEEELTEVEGILDNLDVLLERLDQAAEIVNSMVEVA